MLFRNWRPWKKCDLVVDSSNANPGAEWTYIEKLAASAFCKQKQTRRLRNRISFPRNPEKVEREREREKEGRKPRRNSPRENRVGDCGARGRGRRSWGGRRRRYRDKDEISREKLKKGSRAASGGGRERGGRGRRRAWPPASSSAILRGAWLLAGISWSCFFLKPFFKNKK